MLVHEALHLPCTLSVQDQRGFSSLACTQMAITLFRVIGSLGRTMVVANTLGSFFLLLFFILSGAVPFLRLARVSHCALTLCMCS